MSVSGTITGSNDVIAISTGGVLSAPSRPSQPTLALVAGTNSVVATITGDSGVTHYLYYKSGSDTEWQTGGNRTGNGTITVTGLSDDVPYIFAAYSQKANGVVSLPAAAILTLAAVVTNQLYDILADTAADFLTEFGEQIEYLPAGGGSRSIKAIVDREPPAELDGMPGAHATRTTITVANNSTTGISSSEINLGGDKVEVSVRINETARQKRITGIISQDNGMMTLEVR